MAGPDLAGLRLDVALSRLLPGISRVGAARLAAAGRVRLSGRRAKPAARLRGGEAVEVEIPPAPPGRLAAQDLPLAVLFEDRDLLVLDKAAGMVVHPAPGAPHSTVVNALLHRLGPGSPRRIGLVHRLDRGTSGCLVVARNEAALEALQGQWKSGTVEKDYLAICHGRLPARGRLDTPYGRRRRDRTRFTGRGRHPRRAVTEWTALEVFQAATLARVRLQTGRTHQIRVHLAERGNPLLADAAYGGTRREARLPADDPVRRAAAAAGRQALHAWRLAFDHPRSGRRLAFEAPLPADLAAALAVLRGATP